MSKKNLLILLLLASAFALISAYISQYVFGYQPCILCLYQRVPFFTIIGLTALSLIFLKQEKFQKIVFFLCVIFLLINCGIAFYHVGVEQKIFKGFSGCSAQNLNEVKNIEELKEALLAAKSVRCDEPQFFFLHLSMAAWNFIFCLALALFSLFLARPHHQK